MDMFLSFLQEAGHFFLYYVLTFVVVLGIMIFVHELGHFLLAKYFDVKVLKFALGFGPKIVAKTIGETEYSIRYVPLGGFVKMLGEDIEDDEEDEDTLEISPEDAARSFSNKHPLKRIIIAAAGPFFNLLLAFVLYWGLFYFSGKYIDSTEIGQVTPDSPASRAGLLKGDVIKSVHGREITDWYEIKETIYDKAGLPVEVTVERDGEPVTVTVIPEESKQEVLGQEVKVALIGVVSSGKYVKKDFGLLGAMKEAAIETWDWIVRICQFIVKLFTGALSIKMVGGPIMIGQITGQMAQVSLLALIPFMAAISINLGILNLFPIPILDGGLIVFLFIELLIGKPLSVKKREWAQKIGLSLLILLMVVVFYNDILRLFALSK
ncbi:MAG: RIP metalloprotease RseP [Deltaproteobacteria bacterium]|nr:RIP metalloprotease RseP [Deltaproteobacteria bacterium]